MSTKITMSREVTLTRREFVTFGSDEVSPREYQQLVIALHTGEISYFVEEIMLDDRFSLEHEVLDVISTEPVVIGIEHEQEAQS